MRRFPAFLGVVGIASALVLVGVPAAQAVEPAPPPVLEIPDVPSKYNFMGPVPGSGNQASDMLRAMLGFKAKTPAVLRPPVPITAPTAFQRAVGGSIMLLPQLAWAIGANGTLTAIAVISGTDYSSVYCAQPDWYQGVTWAVNMTVAPECVGAVANPNSDVTPGAWQPLVMGGTTYMVFKGTAGGLNCYTGERSAPTGYSWRYRQLSSHSWQPITFASSPAAQCTTAFGATANRYISAATADGPAIGLANASTGVMVSEMTQSVGDPTRTPKCRITWSDSTVTTGTGTTYKESTGLPLSSAGLGCESAYVSKPGHGPALMPSRIQVESDDGGSITTISDQEVPPMTETQRLPMTTGNGRGLVLEKVVADVVKSCMTWEADCANWWEETDEGTTPGTYKCSFGGVTIDLAECGPYRRTFDTKTSTPTIADPVTGEDVEWSAGPDLNTTNPGTGLAPGDACMAQWASVANPIEWVLQPVKCALVWAFVPRASVVTATQVSIASAWSTTMPGKLPGIVSAALVVPGDPGGCMGPHVYIPIGGMLPGWQNIDFYPLAACEAPMSTVASLARTIGAAVLIFGTGLGIIRRGSAVVNAPGVGGGSS